MDVDAHAVTGALDLHAGDAGALHALGQQLADLHVLVDIVAVALAGLGAVSEPPGVEVGGNAQAEAVRVNLLAHLFSPSSQR